MARAFGSYLPDTSFPSATVVTYASSTSLTGTQSQVLTDTGGVTLTPGFWIVVGYATVVITDTRDSVEILLRNQTAGADISGSNSGSGVNRLANNNIGLMTYSHVDLTVQSTFVLVINQNGVSTPAFRDRGIRAIRIGDAA